MRESYGTLLSSSTFFLFKKGTTMGKDLKGKEIAKGIRQNKDGRYEARYVDRFSKRKSIYGTSKVEIKNKLAEALAENEEKKNVKKRMTISQWYPVWMTSST